MRALLLYAIAAPVCDSAHHQGHCRLDRARNPDWSSTDGSLDGKVPDALAMRMLKGLEACRWSSVRKQVVVARGGTSTSGKTRENWDGVR
jgi:hypothetical protein